MGSIAVKNNIAPNTVMLDATHGSATWFMDSYGWTSNILQEPSYASKIIYFEDDVAPRARAKASSHDQYGKSDAQPLYNLAAFYSCDALDGLWAAEAYKMTDPVIFRAIVGFGKKVATTVVDVALYNQNPNDPSVYEKPLNVHAAKFFELLGTGKYVDDAAYATDQIYRVIDGASPPGVPVTQPMLVMGNVRTRLKHVYLSLFEWNQLSTGGGSTNIDILEITAGSGGGS